MDIFVSILLYGQYVWLLASSKYFQTAYNIVTESPNTFIPLIIANNTTTKVGIVCLNIPSMMEFCLACVYTGLVHVVITTVSSYVNMF